MPGHYFISYSDADGRDFAQRLHDALEPSFTIWFDKHELKPGIDWDAQFRAAISACAAFLFVMTPDSVDDTCTCKNEYSDAFKFKKTIVPLKAHKDAQAPFRLNARQYIDFTGNFDAALAKLREHLEWLKSPAGELQSLNDRLADANRDLRRADDTNRARIEADIAQLKQDIEKQKRVVENPQAEAERTAQSIQAGIERAREPEKPVGGATRTKFINPPPMAAPRWWQDRYRENEIIRDFLRDDAMRLLTLNGRAGIGKTTLVCRLLKSLEAGHLPDDLGALNVDGIVYLSAIGTRAINTPNLFADLCKLLPTATAPALDALYRDPKIAPREKLLALAEKFPRGRVIVLLDNFEIALDANGDLADAELDAALRALLDAPHHAIKIILTTRVAPRALQLAQPARQTYLPLDEGLPVEFAIKMLREMDTSGIVHFKDADDALLARAREYTRGFPRALEALHAILAADRYTTLEEILAQPRMPENIVHALVGEAFNRLDPLAERVMIALATFNRPVPPAAIDYLLQPFLPSVDSAPVLNRLVNMQFARREAGRYHLHLVDREYAFARLPRSPAPLPPSHAGEQGSRGAGENFFNQHDALTRAADYFAATRQPRETWKTLADLEPQLNEFDLRCAAGDYDTAASVLLEIDFDYLLLWGHFRLMIELHEKLQGKISDARLKQNSAGNLGSANYSIGQIPKAIAFYEQALAFAREEKNRGGEGAWLGNLGNAYSDLGDTRRAIEFYERALAIAREIGDKRGEGSRLGNLGLAYSNLGDTRRAIEFYERALAIAREIGDKRGEGSHLGNLGNAYSALGDTRRAIEFYERALAIAREIGDKRGEGSHLGNLGNAYSALGDTRRAIEFYERALAIAREIGDKRGEGNRLGNLGNTYSALGDTRRAIEFYERALAIAREIGDKLAESRHGGNLAEVLVLANRFDEAIKMTIASAKIGEEISSPRRGNYANATLALAHLHAAQQKDLTGFENLSGLDHLTAARAAIESACKFDVPQNNHIVHALRGIIALAQHGRDEAFRQDQRNASPLQIARESFHTALAHADALLAQTPEFFDALDTKGVALCGLGLCEETRNPFSSRKRVSEAVAAFRAARNINRDPGIVARVARLVDALARTAQDFPGLGDLEGLLTDARRAAEGTDNEL